MDALFEPGKDPSYPSEHAAIAGAASPVLAHLYPKEPARLERQAAEIGRARAAAEVLAHVFPDQAQHCAEGSFEINQTPTPDEGNPLGSGRCPDEGQAVAIDTGELQLAVRTQGRWRTMVEQQGYRLDRRAPLPKMTAEGAEVVASGRFYEIERRGRGETVLHELPSGRLALRLEGSATSANTDLFVWVSKAKRPRTTQQALRSDHVELAR